MKNEFQRTASNAGTIGIAAFGGALVGFVLQLLVAFFYGAGSTTDAYFMAQSTSELLSKVLLGGSITSVFIPLFVERLTRGRRADAWSLALNILHLTGAVYLAAVVLLGVFAEPFIRFVAPGFREDTTLLSVGILRVLLPSFFFLYMVDLASAMLHSLKQFRLPALLRIVAPTVTICSVLALTHTLGIYSLALGVVIGSVIQFSILARGLMRQGLSYRFVFDPSDPYVKRLLRLVYPFIFSVLVTAAAGIVYRILVSDLTEGSLASLKFAEKISQLIIIMFLNSVTMVVYPLMSEKASRNDLVGLKDTLGSAIRLIFFVTVPIIVGVALLRAPLIELVYLRGEFSMQDAAMTSIALFYLIIGLTTNGISSALGYAVLALQQTKASVAVTIVSQAIAMLLFVLLVPIMGHAGLALGSSLVPVSIAIMYFLYLSKTITDLRSIFVHPTYAQTLILAAIMAPVVYVLADIVPIIVSILFGAGIFFGFAHLWGVQEMKELTLIVRGRLRKWRVAA